MSANLVSAELRRIEAEVDDYHLANPLMQCNFAEAAWYFLAFCEDLAIFDIVRESSGKISSTASEAEALADNIITHSKHPLRWIARACLPGGKPPSMYEDAAYQAAAELSDLSMRYLPFESAFSYATWGLVTLAVEGNHIKTSGPMRKDSRFDAYDRLVQNIGTPEIEPAHSEFVNLLAASIRVKEKFFQYRINPRLIHVGLESLGPIIESRFNLPIEWRLPRYTLKDFREVAKVLWVLAYAHYQARIIAAASGCVGLGYCKALLLMENGELLNRVRRYSGVAQDAVEAILGDLTYGARGQMNPDPALQPIIQLSRSTVALAPNLVLNSSMERNLAVLLNRLPEERKAYMALSQGREAEARQRFISQLSGMPFRFWYGEVSEWGTAAEVDLVVVSDDERCCLLLELKSFIAPAEAREIKERSEEILKGIEQVRDRRQMMAARPKALYSRLGIDSQYKTFCALASETSIGTSYVQQADISVANAAHLVAKLRKLKSLAALCSWLENRDYLPVEGVHYQTIPDESNIGAWTVEWYKIKVLSEDYL